MKKGLFIGLAAAMLLALPVMADGELEFTVDTDSSGTYYSWDSETKTLTLENGFEVTAVNTESAIKVPHGTTIIVEGNAEIHSDENGILVAGLDDGILAAGLDDEGDEIDNPDPLKIQINKGAELSIDCGYDAITSYNYDVWSSTYYTDIIITGQDRDTSILDIDGEYGLYTYGNISVKNVGITIETEYECIYAGNVALENNTLDLTSTYDNGIYAYYGNITIKDSTLDLTSTGYYEYEGENYYEYYDGIDAYENVTISNSNVTIESGGECIYAYDGDITIKDSTLDLTSNTEESITSDAGSVHLNNVKGRIIALEDNDGQGEEAIDAGTSVLIENCDLYIFSASDDGIDPDNGNITIINSKLDIVAEEEEGLDVDYGIISISGSSIKIVSYASCINSDAGITITDTSLDLTCTGQEGIMDVDSVEPGDLDAAYANTIFVDRTFNLYDADGNQLNDKPVEYSADLIRCEELTDEYGVYTIEYWEYNGQSVYRLVTAADTSVYVEKVFRSLRNISFAGEGVSAMKNLSRALGSTVNLNRFAPEAREGYTFTGWYADAACTRPVTRLVVTGDMVIYAGWNAIVEEEAAAE